MIKNKNIINIGLKDSIPFGIAFIFLYLAIGALGKANHLSLLQTVSTTVMIFSTPLQYLIVQNYTLGLVLVPLILAMNARFLLMSAYLAPFFKKEKTKRLIISNILIVPSVFAACKERFKFLNSEFFIYFLSIGIPIYIGSIICTIIGYKIGYYINNEKSMLFVSMILPLQFTCIAGKHWPNIYETISYWAGFLIFPISVLFFKEFNLMIIPFLIGFSSVLVQKIFERKK